MATTSKDQPSTSSKGGSSKTTGKASDKFARLNRFRDLELKMNEARKMNQAEVAAEDERIKRPKNFNAKKKRVEWEKQEAEERKESEAKGEDYDRVKMLNYGAEESDRWDRKRKKKNPDTGFADYEQATFRQYNQLSKKIQRDPREYEREKDRLGDDFYATANTLGLHQRQDPEDAVDRMVGDLEKQIEKRAKYSRRRIHDEEADIDYINERNMKFNQKLERFYGKYTAEIKQNLERGTAV